MNTSTKLPNRSRAVLTAMALTLLALLVSRLSGLVRDVVIAYKFGTTATTDSFVAAFTLPDLLSSLLLAGLVGVAVIPILVRATSEGGEERWAVTNALLNLVTLGTALGALIGIVFARPIVSLLTPGLDSEHLDVAASLARIMYPALVFFAAGSLFMAVLNAANRFTIPNLAGLFVNVAMIVGAVSLGPAVGIAGLAWGFLAGSLIQVAVQLPLVRGMGYRYRLLLGLRDPRVQMVFAAMLPFLIVTAFQYSRLIAERWLGSQIAPGTISIVNFANRLLLFQPSLIVAPVATVLYPLLARSDMTGDIAEAKHTIARGISIILVGAIPAAIVLRYLSHPIVAIVYQRGQFAEASSNATAYLLGLYALALIPLALNDFITRTYFARRRHSFVLAANGVGLLLTVIGDIVFIKLVGFPGLALGAAFGAWSLLAMFVISEGFWRPRAIQLITLKSAIAGIAMAIATVALYNGSLPVHITFLRLALAAGAGGLLYFSLLWLAASREERSVFRSLRSGIGLW